jgi:hypothetical protein
MYCMSYCSILGSMAGGRLTLSATLGQMPCHYFCNLPNYLVEQIDGQLSYNVVSAVDPSIAP